MLSFKAYFWNSDVYINEKYRFDSNEILTAYLNDKHYNHLYEQDFIYNLKYFKRHLQVARNMDYQDFINYNDTVYESMRFTDELNKMLKKLPPYNKILGDQITRLDDILNTYNYFFENGIDLNEYYYDEDTVTEYGMGEKDEYGNYTMRLFKFQLQPTERIDMEDDDTRLSLQELNQAVSGFLICISSLLQHICRYMRYINRS